MEVLSGIGPEYLTAENKKKSLREVNTINLKRSSKLKGRIFDNGEPHRKFVRREEAKWPTITQEGILSTMVIDEYEDKKVANFDVPGAYLQKDLPKDKFTLLLL